MFIKALFPKIAGQFFLLMKLNPCPAARGIFVWQDSISVQRYVFATGGQSESRLNDYKEWLQVTGYWFQVKAKIRGRG
jgi:hypothetical protein